ncbi:MAG TPA: iron chelate uptake ABC transporter family permease subunit [candidate division Zixibacteria bacterium]|nr:iron chelate uptake ABC transporter family permease subunit [candidate division Zixibacteria bacterium]
MRAAATTPALVGRLPNGPTLTRAALVLGVGLGVLLAVLLLAVAAGSVGVGPGDTAAILGRRLLALPIPETWAPATETIIFELRLPRVLTAMLVGGALAMAGAAFQAVFRNPLADPYIIGTAAGASLGAVIGIVLPVLLPALALGAGTSLLGIGLVQVLAFAGGLGTVLLVYAVARSGGRVPVVTLLLTGYAVSSVLAAAVALLMFSSGRALAAVFSWLMGSLADASWPELAFAAPLVAASLALLVVRWRGLNLLLLGDAAAGNLGLDVEREKLVLTMLATLATSAAVAVSGTIGFVGLVVPHLLRLAIGPDHRLLLPASLLFGAALLALADLGARLIGGVPVGVVTALIGAPFFLWLLRRSRAAAPVLSA